MKNEVTTITRKILDFAMTVKNHPGAVQSDLPFCENLKQACYDSKTGFLNSAIFFLPSKAHNIL